jgi:hypothetical protein
MNMRTSPLIAALLAAILALAFTACKQPTDGETGPAGPQGPTGSPGANAVLLKDSTGVAIGTLVNYGTPPYYVIDGYTMRLDLITGDIYTDDLYSESNPGSTFGRPSNPLKNLICKSTYSGGTYWMYKNLSNGHIPTTPSTFSATYYWYSDGSSWSSTTATTVYECEDVTSSVTALTAKLGVNTPWYLDY